MYVPPPRPKQSVELGTINYTNLTAGDNGKERLELALRNAEKSKKPIFANFVEFPG